MHNSIATLTGDVRRMWLVACSSYLRPARVALAALAQPLLNIMSQSLGMSSRVGRQSGSKIALILYSKYCLSCNWRFEASKQVVMCLTRIAIPSHAMPRDRYSDNGYFRRKNLVVTNTSIHHFTAGRDCPIRLSHFPPHGKAMAAAVGLAM